MRADSRLFRALCQRAEMVSGSMSTQGISNSLWALATIGVCERERERERESVCVCVCGGGGLGVCVCERERERARVIYTYMVGLEGDETLVSQLSYFFFWREGESDRFGERRDAGIATVFSFFGEKERACV